MKVTTKLAAFVSASIALASFFLWKNHRKQSQSPNIPQVIGAESKDSKNSSPPIKSGAMTKLDALMDQLFQEVRVYEERVYDDDGENALEGYTEIIQDGSGKNYARRLDWKPVQKSLRFCAVRHHLFAPPLGFSLNQYFPPELSPEIPLPADVVHFYKRICHARLLWKREYVLDPPGWPGKDQIWGKVEPPNFLLRFCEIGVEDFYALRTKDNGAHWDVILIMGGDSDTNLAIESATLAASFTEWLERMMKSDGWPPEGGDSETNEEQGLYSDYYLRAERRVPTEEVIRKFGLPEKLLPPAARMETWEEGMR